MKQNMGSLDRILRVLFALTIGALYFTDVLSGTAAVLLGLLAGIFFLTGLAGFCPLYAPFKFATKKIEKN